jgi:cold shock CspA family protein
MRQVGRLTQWKDDQGYGFITPKGGGDHVFVHVKSFGNRQQRPRLNDIVNYDLGFDEKNRDHANNVTYVVDVEPALDTSLKGPGSLAFAVFFALFVVWTAQQILESFPFDSAPRYLLRDNDRIYGCEFRRQLEVMGIREVRTSFRSPWQNAFVERVIGSIRRECLDHVIVVNEESLRRVLHSYIGYYHASRLHLSLEKDSPTPRAVQSVGNIVAIPQVGGLHHRYERRAA